MSSLKLAERTKTGLHTKTIEEVRQASFSKVKRLLAIAISSITYVRGLVPEGSFKDKDLYGMKLKILNRDCGSSALTIIEWMNGAFEAIKEGYLRQLDFMVLEDPDNVQTAIETYCFQFGYDENGLTMTHLINKEKGNTITIPAQVQEKHDRSISLATKQMLKELAYFTTRLDPLQETTYLAMRLSYFPEKVPNNYQLKGYENTSNENDPVWGEVNYIGKINYACHSLKLNAYYSNTRRLPSNRVIQETEAMEVEKESQQKNENLNTCFQASNRYEQTSNVSTQSKQAKPLTENTEIQNTNTERIVSCPCGYNANDGIMIQCEICHCFQHAICFCFYDLSSCTSYHICNTCADTKDPNRLPSDQSLMVLNSDKLQFTCMWRRTLQALDERQKISVTSLINRLHASKRLAKEIFSALKEADVFESSDAKKNLKTINKKKLHDVYYRDVQHTCINNERQRHDLQIKYENNQSMGILSGSGLDVENETPCKIDKNCMRYSLDMSPSQDQFKVKRKRHSSKPLKVKRVKRN